MKTAEALLQDLHSVLQDTQVVSYIWFARQHQTSSNYAKLLLQKYAEQHRSTVKVIYMVSGYVQRDTTLHVTRLVDESNLADCQAEFREITGTHVHSLMPLERHPVTDAGRLCAESTIQARQLYHSIVRQNALVDGSADVFARNSTSSITFDAGLPSPMAQQHLAQQQQQLEQQQLVPPDMLKVAHGSSLLPAGDSEVGRTTAAIAEAEPSPKRMRSASTATAAEEAEAHTALDEDVCIIDDDAQVHQGQQDLHKEAAGDNVRTGTLIAQQGRPAGAGAVDAGRSSKSSIARVTGNKATGRGRVKAGANNSAKAQTNITNFFGKR